MKELKLTACLWVLARIMSAVVAGCTYQYMKKKRIFLQERHIDQIGHLRMENIRNRISSHFTLNVLNREISQFKGDGALCDGLTELVRLLRKSLEFTERLSVSFYDELELVETYAHLEQGQLGDDFSMDIKIEGGSDIQQVIIPLMIVQIPVEGALKYGLFGIEGSKSLRISVCRRDNGIPVDICGNGRGYSPQIMSLTRGTGAGLKVLYQTIQLLNDKDREKIYFEIKNLTNDGWTETQALVYVPFGYSYNL